MPDLDAPNAVQAFYLGHHRWLLGWLRRRVRDNADAADLMHDTFVHLLGDTRPAEIREPRAFLATIAKRLISNRHKRQLIEAAYLDAVACASEAFAPSPESLHIAFETLLQIDNALDGLPAKVRSAFLMAHMEEMPYAEIANRLAVSRSSVKQYLARANMHCLFALSA
ncbi:sigma-70 family RNA polymerase sigma factor [Achromobacter aloeverae]